MTDVTKRVVEFINEHDPFGDCFSERDVERLEKNNGSDVIRTLERAADLIRECDGGDQHTETGWKSDEMLDLWLDLLDVIAKAKGTK